MDIKDKISFSRIFTRYFDDVVIGIVAGLVVFYGLKINNGLYSALYIFFSALVLVTLYSIFVWLELKYKWDNNAINILKKYWKEIALLFIFGYFYMAVHELLHYFFIKTLGYSAIIHWSIILPKVVYLTPLDQVLRNHYFLSAMAPYVFGILLLGFLVFLSYFIKNKIILLLGVIPFLDALVNILAIPLAYFTKNPNDFLNIWLQGYYWQTLFIALSPIVLYIILLLNYNRLKKKNG